MSITSKWAATAVAALLMGATAVNAQTDPVDRGGKFEVAYATSAPVSGILAGDAAAAARHLNPDGSLRNAVGSSKGQGGLAIEVQRRGYSIIAGGLATAGPTETS